MRLDVAIATAAFALSLGVPGASGPVSAELREPDAGAFILAGLYCGSIVVRHRAPAAAVLAGMLLGVTYAAAQYPPALMPVALLSVYTAAAELPPRRATLILACAERSSPA